MNDRLITKRFPRSSAYHPDWVIGAASGGANALWLTEWLADSLDLRPGMRVLDLGCGRAASSIFLHREFGVQVWATDLWFSASENLRRVRDAGIATVCFPSTVTRDRFRSPTTSSTRLCQSIRFPTTAPTTRI